MGPYQYLNFYTETQFYDELEHAILNRFDHYQDVLADADQEFERLQKATLGEAVQQLNSLEQIALRGDESLFGVNLFDKIRMLKGIKLAEIRTLADEFCQDLELARYLIK